MLHWSSGSLKRQLTSSRQQGSSLSFLMLYSGSSWPGEDFLFPENASYCFHIGLKLTDFADTGYNNSPKYVLMSFVLFGDFSLTLFHLRCSWSKMASLEKIAYKFLVMPHYNQISDSLVLSTFFFQVSQFLYYIAYATHVFEQTLPKWSTNNDFFTHKVA